MDEFDIEEPELPKNIAPIACVFSLGLGVFAVAVGRWTGTTPLDTITPRPDAIPQHLLAILAGLAATLPLLLMLWIVQRTRFRPLAELRTKVNTQVVPLFSESGLWELAAVSAAAGVGEEMLFRGLLQTQLTLSMEGSYRPLAALLVASTIFGVCHWVTPMYALLATLIGAYLGALFLVTDNLLAPIVAHAVYDFIALIYLVRIQPPTSSEPDSRNADTTDPQTRC